jgi:2-polyprenyl-3-methyl-5-hydroxy-6-metoxy-1,4-benzoquinol methylase
MDDPTLAPEAHQHALAGLARINRLSHAGAAVWDALRPFARPSSPPMRVGDLACGGGEVLVDAATRADHDGAPVEWIGWDISDLALDVARRRTEDANLAIRFEQRNVIDGDVPSRCDVLMCSLFLHHLDPPAVVDLLRRMGEAAGRGVVINDLRRTWTGLVLAGLVPRLLTTSPVVHVDALRSARAAYTPADLEQMAKEARLHGGTIERRWPSRMIMRWMKR